MSCVVIDGENPHFWPANRQVQEWSMAVQDATSGSFPTSLFREKAYEMEYQTRGRAKFQAERSLNAI